MHLYWRLYCETEEAFVFCYSGEKPTQCPHGAEHIIRDQVILKLMRSCSDEWIAKEEVILGGMISRVDYFADEDKTSLIGRDNYFYDDEGLLLRIEKLLLINEEEVPLETLTFSHDDENRISRVS